MTQPYTSRNALSLAVVAMLAACGGGESPQPSAKAFAARISQGAERSDRLQALGVGGGSSASAVEVAVTNAQAFQWAQLQFPEIFGTAAPVNIGNFAYGGQVYDVRQFGANYLGISGGRAYGLGTFTNGQLVDFGAIQGYAAQICQRVNCGTTGGGTGTLNGCVQPASEALRIGNQFRAVFSNTTLVPTTMVGEYQLEGEVKAATTFEGQSAVRLQSKITSTQAGVTIDSNTDVFEQAGSNGLINSLGVESVTTLAGFSLTSRTVNNPADPNNQFTLTPGQSLTKTVNTTATYVNPPLGFPALPTTGSTTTTYTYEARVEVTVLGRTYDTCRYKEATSDDTEVTTSWYIFGKGVPAQIEVRNAAGALLSKSELKSGSLNGAPL